MLVTKNLFIPFHQQDESYYCGPACLQMVLTSMGTPVELLLQDRLYDEISLNNTTDPAGSWYSAPDGMLKTIAARNPSPNLHSFLIYAEDFEFNISMDIIYTIERYQIGPIVLVLEMMHWVVVSGFQLREDPVSDSGTAITIMGFWIKNPLPVTPMQIPAGPPPPHGAFDPCGWGNGDIQEYGNPNLYVSYFTWQLTYMTPVRDGFWKGKYLAICDPVPKSDQLIRQSPLKSIYSGEKIMNKKTAGECAMLGLKEHGMFSDKSMEKILKNARAEHEPVLVHRLDLPNDFYYIVQILNDEKHISAQVCVDALFGYFMQANFASEKVPMIRKWVLPNQILEILGKRVEFKREKKILIIHPEAVSIYPCLVWRPCKESLSLTMPFYMVTVKNEHIYVRVDGVVFSSLTTNERGL